MKLLEEAIKHCEEIADEKMHEAESWELSSKHWGDDKKSALDNADQCRECAEEHRQLAECLKDYKRLLAIEKGIDVRCGNCKHDGSDDGICEECFDYRRWEEM